MQPAVLHNPYNYLLSSVEASVRVVTDLENETEFDLICIRITGSFTSAGRTTPRCTHYNVQSSRLALVEVTTGAPVLPLSRLFARSLLPHVVSVVEAPRVWTVLL